MTEQDGSDWIYYPVVDINPTLRKTMPKLDAWGDISKCKYCEKNVTRGKATPRHSRPEVEHIVEVQAFVSIIKDIYQDPDDPEYVWLPVMSVDWRCFKPF